jgi:hypothetical protein
MKERGEETLQRVYVKLTMKAPATSMLARLLVFPRPK